MNTIPSTHKQESKGYLSEEHKRKFTITAGIVGAVFFILQFIVPPMFMFIIMPGMMFFGDYWIKDAEPQRGALWRNSIWYVETSFSARPSARHRIALKKLDLDSEEGPEAIASLSMGNPWLLAGSDRLWIISSSAVGFFRNWEINIISEEKTLGDISRPFLYEGHPAVVEERPTSLTLMVFSEDTWQEKLRFKIKFQENRGRIHRYLQVLWGKGRLHLFLKFGETLYYREGPPPAEIDDRRLWQPVAEVRTDWIAVLINGVPVVFHRGTRDSKIVGLRQVDNTWRQFFTFDFSLIGDMGVYPLGDSGRFAMLLQSFPGSLRLVQIDGERVVKETRHGGGFPFPRPFAHMMVMFYAPMFILPLILAVILSGLMRRHRICEHHAESLSMAFASLTRRALAQIVDFFVLGVPALAGFFVMFPGFDLEKMFENPVRMLGGFGLMVSTLLWVFICLFVFSFLEGKWGVTPGKWALGIRVLGTDLRPCGFGRAFVRNLLKFIDGFFNFMIGILLVALTENWQRVGDMAARTVVVDVKQKETLILNMNTEIYRP